MKNKTILFFGIIIVSLLLLQPTYAKYKDKLSGSTNISIAKWNLKINNQTINGHTTLTNDISPVLPGNEYIAPNVLAPNATGYYDIIVDSTEVDVSFNYTITPTVSELSDVTDLVITGYEINPTNTPNIQELNGNITGTINYNTANTIIRVHIKWEDEINTTMDNESDTAVVMNPDSQAIINNQIVFNQIR